jgi:hypothetical protein
MNHNYFELKENELGKVSTTEEWMTAGVNLCQMNQSEFNLLQDELERGLN